MLLLPYNNADHRCENCQRQQRPADDFTSRPPCHRSVPAPNTWIRHLLQINMQTVSGEVRAATYRHKMRDEIDARLVLAPAIDRAQVSLLVLMTRNTGGRVDVTRSA